MKQFITGPAVPTANICINKSRIKVYEGDIPTVYLERGTSFQMEFFNPTSDTILAKIYLNGKAISQGGLVLKPGQRVFLDRYLDVAKKFLFDTYEVSNTQEVREAIENNGDFKVEFFREYIAPPIYPNPLTYTTARTCFTNTIHDYNTTRGISNYSSTNAQYSHPIATMDFLSMDSVPELNSLNKWGQKRSKKIETGRVEAGGQSAQEIKTVSKSFQTWPFHTTEYKLLPMSQKVNTSADLNVKEYCVNCGGKVKNNWKFCPICSNKI